MKSNPSLRAVDGTVASIEGRLLRLNQELARHEGVRETVAATLAEAEARVAATGDEAELLRTVLDRLLGMKEVWERKFQRSTATIVSEGLSLVFGEELQLVIRPATKADMDAVDFVLLKDSQEEDIMEGQGGGYIGIIAFLLRVLLIMAARPLLRLVLVLDEPFAQVSPEYRSPLAEMVAALIDRLDFQVIMVTHEREYVDVADVAVSFEKAHGITQVRPLKGAEAA